MWIVPAILSETFEDFLCLGTRVIGSELAKDIIRAWLYSSFLRKERHVRRLVKIEAI